MANNTNRTPHQKGTKLKSKFSLTLGFLNQALNNLAQASRREKELFKFQHNVLLSPLSSFTLRTTGSIVNAKHMPDCDVTGNETNK